MPHRAIEREGHVGGVRLAERSELNFATPLGRTVTTFRMLCEEHGEATASIDGRCPLCRATLDFHDS